MPNMRDVFQKLVYDTVHGYHDSRSLFYIVESDFLDIVQLVYDGLSFNRPSGPSGLFFRDFDHTTNVHVINGGPGSQLTFQLYSDLGDVYSITIEHIAKP